MINYLSKFLYVLPSPNKNLVYWFLLFIFLSILEVFGIGIIGPFIKLASNPDFIDQKYWLSWTYNQLNFTQKNQFIVLLGFLIIILFCFKSLIRWYIQVRIFHFIFVQREKLIDRLMVAYLEAPYVFFFNKNSAQILNDINQQTAIFSSGILNSFLTLSSNIVNIIAISILLCLVNPLIIASLIFISIPLVILFNLFRKKMRFWGKELYEANQEIIRDINHSFGGFKETRIIGCGSYFREQTIKQAQRYADTSISFYAFKLSPRIIIETLLVIFLIGYTSISLLYLKDIQDLASVISIFGLASIRLIPAFSQLTQGLGKLANTSYALNQLYLDLNNLEIGKRNGHSEANINSNFNQVCTSKTQNNQVINLSNDIILENVIYHYPNATENALNGISLKIFKGQSVALIGKSGAGKTTLVDLILGLLTPRDGDIKVDGVSIYNHIRSWQNLIGYIPQSIFLIDDTMEKNIAFGVPEELIDQHRLNKAIQAAQLTEVVENLPKGLHTRVGERGVMLSGGQRQRVGIARTLYHEREILVLDEATSALDNATESLVTESIKSLSGIKTLIIIAHRLTTVEHCDCIYLMDKGKIVQSGSYKEVVLREHMISS